MKSIHQNKKLPKYYDLFRYLRRSNLHRSDKYASGFRFLVSRIPSIFVKLNKKNFVRVGILFFFLFFAFPASAQLVLDCANPFDCNFDYLMAVVAQVVDFAILIAAPLAAIAFMWAGVLYFTAMGGDTGKITKAHHIFTSVLIGFILVLAAWLIVKVIVNTLAPGTSLLSAHFYDVLMI